MKPLAIDLYCGLGGWAEGFLAEGYDVIGFDIERHDYGTGGYPGQLVLQDVLTLHGSQFKDATVIVGSSPCQEFSYRAMPWKRAKALPPPELGIKLFQAQFRIQREANEAAYQDGCIHCGIFHPATTLNGCEFEARYIPLMVENVKGAQPWVGSARWHFGSYYLWGDVPALMPTTFRLKNTGGSWFGQRDGKLLERNDPRDGFAGYNHPGKALDGRKNDGGSWFAQAHNTGSGKSRNPVTGIKGSGGSWFTPDSGSREEVGHWKKGGCVTRCFSSKSTARKAASAQIAKIPFELASHIARVFRPDAPTPDSVCNDVEPLDFGGALNSEA